MIYRPQSLDPLAGSTSAMTLIVRQAAIVCVEANDAHPV